MRHHHDHAGEALDEGLQPAQPVEVEVVGGLVEQQDVHPGQQDRGQGQPGRLAARQRGGRLVEHRGVEPEVGADLRARGRRSRPRRPPSSAPARRRSGRPRRATPAATAAVAASNSAVASATPVRRASRARPVSPARRSGSCASSATGADGGVTVTDPASGASAAGEHRQQRRLADAVRADDAEAGAGADGQVDAAEDGGAGAVDDQVARDDGDGGGRSSQGTPFGRAPARAGSDGQGLCSLHGGHATGRAGIARPSEPDLRGSSDSAYQSSSGRVPGRTRGCRPRRRRRSRR